MRTMRYGLLQQLLTVAVAKRARENRPGDGWCFCALALSVHAAAVQEEHFNENYLKLPVIHGYTCIVMGLKTYCVVRERSSGNNNWRARAFYIQYYYYARAASPQQISLRAGSGPVDRVVSRPVRRTGHILLKKIPATILLLLLYRVGRQARLTSYTGQLCSAAVSHIGSMYRCSTRTYACYRRAQTSDLVQIAYNY